MATINGMTVKECCKQLARYKMPQKKLYGKYPYYRISEYRERLDEVLGVDHYYVTYTAPQIFRIDSGQEILCLNCRITVLDDEYKPIFYKEGCGSKELQYTKETGRLDGISNVAYSASTSAFKNACKNFCMFGDKSNDDMFDEDGSLPFSETRQTQGNSSKPSDNKTVTERICFVLTEKPEMMREDEHTKKPVYKAVAQIAEGDVMHIEKCEIVFYPNQYKNHVELINELCSMDKPKKRVFAVSASTPRNGRMQYIFKGV